MISVGIDVSKEKSMVCLLRPFGEVVVSPYEVRHTESSLSELADLIGSCDEEIKVVMESTSAYHLPILSYLQDAGIFVSVINPLLMKKYASVSIRKGKTDKLDSVRIANYGLDHWLSLIAYQVPDEIYGELKLLGRQYAHFIEVKVKCKLAMLSYLDRTMPGIKQLILHNRPDNPTREKLTDFADEFWHFDNISSLTFSEFSMWYCEWSKRLGYTINHQKIEHIYALAKNSITTLPSKSPTTKMLIHEATKVMRQLGNTIYTILQRMQELAKQLPEYEIVRDMKGVGDVLAVKLIAEIGDVRRFKNGSALVAYAGIDSPPFQSGLYTGTQRHISKRGSALLRKIGYEIMMCIKMKKPQVDNAVYEFMLKKEAEGKPKRVAKIAALNKFLRIYYARVNEIYRDITVKPLSAY